MVDVFYLNDTSTVANWGSQATNRFLRNLITDAGGEIVGTTYTESLHRYEPNDRLPVRAYASQLTTDVTNAVTDLDFGSALRSVYERDDAVPDTYAQFDDYARAAITGGPFRPEVEAIRSADAVVINLEGYGTDSGRGTRALFFLGYLATEFLDTDCVMANVTLDPLDDHLLSIAANVFPKLDDVVFREPVSARKYAHLCEEYRVGADPAFSSDLSTDRSRLIEAHRNDHLDVRPYATSDFDPSEPYVCVAGNSIIINYTQHVNAGYSGTRTDVHVDGYTQVCRELVDVCPQVVLVVSSHYDEEVLSTVAERLDLYTVGLNTSIADSLLLLANAEVYVGGRYHPTIFAAKGGVPIVPISAVSHKIEAVMELLDVDTHVFDPFDLANRATEIREYAERYIRDGAAFDHLPARIEELSDAAARNVEHLQSVGGAEAAE